MARAIARAGSVRSHRVLNMPLEVIHNPIPSGVVLPYGGATTPLGWQLCDGTAISRATYAALFAAIGTAYGVGDGSTTFNLPDLRGRNPLGKDDMGGASANRVTNAQADILGGSEGSEDHTLVTDEMPAHTHTPNAATTTSSMDPTGNYWGGDVRTDNDYETTTDVTMNTASLANTGGDGAHENMAPYQVFNYIIKE